MTILVHYSSTKHNLIVYTDGGRFNKFMYAEIDYVINIIKARSLIIVILFQEVHQAFIKFRTG